MLGQGLKIALRAVQRVFAGRGVGGGGFPRNWGFPLVQVNGRES